MPDFVVRTTTRKRIEYVLPAETNWGQVEPNQVVIGPVELWTQRMEYWIMSLI